MTAALIIASGKTNRKDHFVPAMKVGTITAIERVALLFQEAGIKRIVVVCDEDNPARKVVSSMKLSLMPVPAGCEMLDSIQAGLSYLQDKCTEVFVSYVDNPLFLISTVQKLLASEGKICVPSCQGQCGHPILLRQPCFGDILAYHGDGGLRAAIKATDIPREIVAVPDIGILSDIQRKQSYAELLSNHDLARLRLSYQLQIGKENTFYDSGVHQLLQLTEELGSLSKACTYTGISYSKGRKIISNMEQQLGYPVLESQQGGPTGGFSKLTERASAMMHSYDAFCMEAETALQDLFHKYYDTV